MKFSVAIAGRGRATVAAYGIADAEHQVEKELAGVWPSASIRIENIGRVGAGRIVEEFQVDFTIRMTLHATGDDAEEAARTALRAARAAAGGTRYAKIEWAPPRVTRASSG